MSRTKQLSIQTTKKEFSCFLDKLKELSKISLNVKLRVVNNEAMLFAIVAEQNKVSKLKSYFSAITALFQNYKHSEDLDFTILDVKNWIKQFSFLLKDEIIVLTLTYGVRDNQVYAFNAVGSDLELSASCGDIGAVKDENIRQAPIASIQTKMSDKNADWSIDLTVEQWEQLKRLAKLETDDTINVVIRDKTVFFEQNIYKQKIGIVDFENCSYTFSSLNLENITKPTNGLIKFSFYPSFVVVNEGESKFMFVLELNN